jgi:hypothetical protein
VRAEEGGAEVLEVVTLFAGEDEVAGGQAVLDGIA